MATRQRKERGRGRKLKGEAGEARGFEKYRETEVSRWGKKKIENEKKKVGGKKENEKRKRENEKENRTGGNRKKMKRKSD